MADAIPNILMRHNQPIPQLGLGTWRMGESRAARPNEVRVLQHGLDCGITLIDTAEMYGEGGAEELVGEAIRGRRDGLTVVSKVYPWNASRRGTVQACERSLKRLGIEQLDLYLLHWRGEHPLADTVAAFEQLRSDGKIRHWGVSNFDTADMRELATVSDGEHCAANQVYYNLAKRWPEATLLPLLRERKVITMAYSPLDQGRLANHLALQPIAAKYGATTMQIALAWLLSFDDVVSIPKTSRVDGVNEIVGALRVRLDDEDRASLENAFPRPKAGARMETT